MGTHQERMRLGAENNYIVPIHRYVEAKRIKREKSKKTKECQKQNESKNKKS